MKKPSLERLERHSQILLPFEKASLNRRQRLILIAHHHSECFLFTITNLEEHVKWIPCAYIRCRIICLSPPRAESHDVKTVHLVKGSFLRSVTRSSTAKTHLIYPSHRQNSLMIEAAPRPVKNLIKSVIVALATARAQNKKWHSRLSREDFQSSPPG